MEKIEEVIRKGSWLHCSCGTWIPLNQTVLVPCKPFSVYKCSKDCVPNPELFGKEPLPIKQDTHK